MDSDTQTEFATFDTNHDGKIDRAEFATSCRRLDIAPNSSAETKDESKEYLDEHGNCVTCGNPEPQTTSDHRQVTSGTPEWKQVRIPSDRAAWWWCVQVPVETRAENNLLH